MDLVWLRNELESKLEFNTTIPGDEPGMSEEVKILNRKLRWHDGVGISCEADQKHAEAIIREAGASNLTSLKIAMSKESKEDVRDKTDDSAEKRKLGMKAQPLVGQILSLAETTRKRALAATANFLAIDRGDIVYCAKELTRHTATPTTADWEKVVRLERYLKNRLGVRLWYKFQETPCQLEIQIGEVAKEHAAAQQEDTQLQDLISSKCGAKHKLLWLSVQRKPNCPA